MNDQLKQWRRCRGACKQDKPLDSRYFDRRTEVTQHDAWRYKCIVCRTARKKQLEAEAKLKTEKWCNGCKATLPIDDFYARKTARDGRQAVCKGCDALRNGTASAVIDGENIAAQRQGKWCKLCGGMEHRVIGVRCRECQLAYRAEPPVTAVTRRDFEHTNYCWIGGE
jgi:hypothetical protein